MLVFDASPQCWPLTPVFATGILAASLHYWHLPFGSPLLACCGHLHWTIRRERRSSPLVALARGDLSRLFTHFEC